MPPCPSTLTRREPHGLAGTGGTIIGPAARPTHLAAVGRVAVKQAHYVVELGIHCRGRRHRPPSEPRPLIWLHAKPGGSVVVLAVLKSSSSVFLFQTRSIREICREAV